MRDHLRACHGAHALFRSLIVREILALSATVNISRTLEIITAVHAESNEKSDENQPLQRATSTKGHPSIL
jgi:hypothetical protein